MRVVCYAILCALALASGPSARAEARKVQRKVAAVPASTPLHAQPLAPGVLLAQKGGQAGAADKNKTDKKPAIAVKCDVIEFHATKTGTPSLDPKLAKHKKALGQAPMTAFDTFKVTGQNELSLSPGKSGTVKFVAKLDVLFKGVKKADKGDRLEFELTADDKDGTRIYRQVHTQDSGATVIQSGGDHDGGKIFFAITCAAQ
jgi:hypothetical protein